jgi:hypothetical protein
MDEILDGYVFEMEVVELEPIPLPPLFPCSPIDPDEEVEDSPLPLIKPGIAMRREELRIFIRANPHVFRQAYMTQPRRARPLNEVVIRNYGICSLKARPNYYYLNYYGVPLTGKMLNLPRSVSAYYENPLDLVEIRMQIDHLLHDDSYLTSIK